MKKAKRRAAKALEAERRFLARAKAGSVEKGLKVLDKLDRHFGTAAGK